VLVLAEVSRSHPRARTPSAASSGACSSPPSQTAAGQPVDQLLIDRVEPNRPLSRRLRPSTLAESRPSRPSLVLLSRSGVTPNFLQSPAGFRQSHRARVEAWPPVDVSLDGPVTVVKLLRSSEPAVRGSSTYTVSPSLRGCGCLRRARPRESQCGAECRPRRAGQGAVLAGVDIRACAIRRVCIRVGRAADPSPRTSSTRTWLALSHCARFSAPAWIPRAQTLSMLCQIHARSDGQRRSLRGSGGNTPANPAVGAIRR
jgi:hypothetical protein